MNFTFGRLRAVIQTFVALAVFVAITGYGASFQESTKTSTSAPAPDGAQWGNCAPDHFCDHGSWRDFGGIHGGCDGVINASALSADGKTIYLAGYFRTCGNHAVNSIVAYDRATGEFRPLGTGTSNGVDEEVMALHIHHGDLYAGGQFERAGNVKVSNLARWDGEEWHTVGPSGPSNPGVDGYVGALASHQDNLVVAGFINRAGELPVKNIARWDGTLWSAFAANGQAGANNYVRALLSVDDKLYAAGGFSMAGGVPANRIAAWTGDSWEPLGSGVSHSGLPSHVQSLALFNGQIVAAGQLTHAGGNPAGGIARWDGNKWSALGAGLSSTDGTNFALTAYGDELIVTGSFESAGGQIVNGIARWDGDAWHAMGSGFRRTSTDRYGRSLLVFDQVLLATGYFSYVDDEAAQSVAVFDDSGWHRLRASPTSGTRVREHAPSSEPVSPVVAIRFRGDLVVAGWMPQAGVVSAGGVARWDGENWHSLAGGVDGWVTAATVVDDELIVVGKFDHAGGVTARNIAAWDGSTWRSVGDGLAIELAGPKPLLSSIVADGQRLYVGGRFATANGISANSVIQWDGHRWLALGDGVFGHGFPAEVSALEVFEGDLYAAGEIVQAGGVPVNHIACWDGTEWSALGLGIVDDTFGSEVNALEVFQGELYVGGSFENAGGLTLLNIAKWDGISWSGLGVNWLAELWGSIDVLTADDDDLYAGGSLNGGWTTQNNHVFRWGKIEPTGQGDRAWHSLGDLYTGFTDTPFDRVHGVAVVDRHVYSVGRFDRIVTDDELAISSGIVGFELDNLFGNGFNE